MFYIGIAAAVLTTIAFLPQIIKAHQTKRTDDLSLIMFILFSLGLMLWIVYGIYLKSAPIIAANVITLVMSLYLMLLKIKHG